MLLKKILNYNVIKPGISTLTNVKIWSAITSSEF